MLSISSTACSILLLPLDTGQVCILRSLGQSKGHRSKKACVGRKLLEPEKGESWQSQSSVHIHNVVYIAIQWCGCGEHRVVDIGADLLAKKVCLCILFVSGLASTERQSCCMLAFITKPCDQDIITTITSQISQLCISLSITFLGKT